ncbi:MAG TPA: hypothetical protein VE326_00645 [Candidatus Binatia bacterium]|nr:hypothetical protein [Candidatus Binatia bacterium]
MRATSILSAMLGALLAVQAYAMPERADPAGVSKPKVTVHRGVTWFYGHRFEAPFTLEYVDDGLAINGYYLPRKVRPLPQHRPTHGDTLRSRLRARTLEILRDAKRNHVSPDQAFAQVEQAYRSSPLVRSVELRGHSLLLTYQDTPGPYEVLLVDPEKIALRDMTPEELAEGQREFQSKTLHRLMDHLESGCLIVWAEFPASTWLPNDPSPRVDLLLRRLQHTDKLTKEEKGFLQSWIAVKFEDLNRMVKRPLRLMAVSLP